MKNKLKEWISSKKRKKTLTDKKVKKPQVRQYLIVEDIDQVNK